MKPTYKSLLIISSAILVAFIIFVVLIRPLQKNYYTHHVDIHGVYLLHPLKIENVEWLDQNNKPFTIDDLKNHWSLLFFGFTHCDSVCPLTLSSLNTFYQNVQNTLPEKDKPQIIFVTIDPLKDTTKRLKEYLAQFNPHFMGGRASVEKTELLKKQFHVLASKNNIRTDQYNHSTELLLINPHAEIQAYFYFPKNPNQLEKDYYAILRSFNITH